ncbi:hypothetical protein [Mesobacillus boroniphilus]|uniref:Uncharacterized protein n=1 Tax=Mesobacillus boroniphilus JCM 21738 TaxID=1294265 RepID=W4RVZ6_9BACI|nr:hypothetical protein [Mesobacillus boroniphilus]GAE47834.1 hypothetical protein JCM21738_4854 [Mesobacillus boroniphilus JCM 21738]
MKKVGFILGIAIVILTVFIFVNKLYYPSLPIENLSAKEAIDKLKESESKIAEIAVEGDSIWFITSSENKGISIADENINKWLVQRDGNLKKKMVLVCSLKKTEGD